MYIIFKEELKKSFKKPLVWALIITFIFLFYISLKSEVDKRMMATYSNEERAFYERSGESYWGEWNNEDRFDERTHEINIELHDRVAKAYKEKNSQEYLKNVIISTLQSKLYFVGTANVNPFLEKMIEEKSKVIWNEYEDEIKFEEINYLVGISPNPLEEYVRYMLSIKEYEYYYKNNIDVFDDSLSHLEITQDFITKVLPMLIILVGVLLTYNIVNKDVNEGSIKLLLTQSIPRWKYYMAKYFSSVVTIIFVTFIPILISNIVMGIKYGFKQLNYPILYDKQGLSRFLPAFNYIDSINQNVWESKFAFTIIPRAPISEGVYLVQRNVEIVPYYIYLILTAVFMVLFILFLVAFVQLISALINNQILSATISIVLYGAAYIYGQKFVQGRHFNLNPFTMNNSARIVAGTQNATMLTTFIILSISTTILLFVGLKYFKRKRI